MRHKFFYISFCLSALFWSLDNIIHWLLYGEKINLIPEDFNELWMRATIVALILAFGWYADYNAFQLFKREEEKHRIFRATVFSTQHILNNLLNQLLLFKIEMDKNKAFNEDLKTLFSQTLEEGAIKVIQLSNVENLTEEEIKSSVTPQEDNFKARMYRAPDKKSSNDN